MLRGPVRETTMKDFVKQRGQGLTEYAIILALVIIAIVGIAVTFGDDIRQMFEGSGSSAPATTNASPAPGTAPAVKSKPSTTGEAAAPEK